jgi:hypothetical protein
MSDTARGRDRHCARCDLTVHDVSSMTRAEVETLLEARERGERVCLHLVVRESDRAVLVADGYVERELRPPPSRMIAAALAATMTACSSAPPQAPHADIAVAPVENAPAPIEVSSPTPPTPPPALPPQETPRLPEEPPPIVAPVTPVKNVKPVRAAPTPAKKIAAPPPNHVLIDGDAW